MAHNPLPPDPGPNRNLQAEDYRRRSRTGRKSCVFFVAEDFVGFGELLEFFLCGLVAGIYVRVVLARQMAVGLAKLLRLGIPADTEYAVIILLCAYSHFCSANLE